MVWSNWRGAVVLLLAWVGLSWSQAPVASPSGRVMTVHENGQSLRCRVQSTWKLADGSTAYQLQVIDSGEMMTIVEDGPSTVVQDAKLGRLKALPMRIFHWGRSRTPPPGVPVSPDVVAVGASSPIVTTSGATTVTGATVSGECSNQCNQCQTNQCQTNQCQTNQCQTGGPRVVSPKLPILPPGKEQVVWWEENQGQRSSPMVVTSGKNPFANQVVVLPGKQPMGTPVVVDQEGNPIPVGSEGRMGTTAPSPRLVAARPNNLVDKLFPARTHPEQVAQTAPVNPEVVVINEKEPAKDPKKDPKTDKKTPRTMQKIFPALRPATEQPKTAPTQTAQAQTVQTQPLPQPAPILVAPPVSQPTTPSIKPGPFVQTGPTMLPTRQQLKPQVAQAETKPATPSNIDPNRFPEAAKTEAAKSDATKTDTAKTATAKTEPAKAMTPAEAASKTPPQASVAAKTTKPSLKDRIHNLLHPKKETIAKPADPKPADKTEVAKTGVAPTEVARTPARVPFSTAADSASPKSLPPAPLPSKTDVAATTPAAPASPAPPLPKEKTDEKQVKKDWRSMWGLSKDTKTPVPGQTTVEQASVKPDAKSLPPSLPPPALPSPALPPSSVAQNKSNDILLSPEKFDPNGNRLAPKGINMNSYRGDPTKSLQTSAIPGSQPAPTATAQAGPAGHYSPPALPGAGDGRMPLGAQSVLAAGSNVPSRVTYVPVPVATVPEPYRPPMPPAAQVPHAPQPNAYVNAFMPQAPPQEKTPDNPMLVNAFSGMNMPQNQAQQMPVAQMPGYPQQTGYMQPQYPVPPGYQPPQANSMVQVYLVPPGYMQSPNMMAQNAPYPQMPMMTQQAMPMQPMMQTPMQPMMGGQAATMNVPRNYPGPQAPNPNGPQVQMPVQMPIQPIQYAPVPAMMPQQPTGNSAMDRRVAQAMPQAPTQAAPGQGTPELAQIVQVLRESPYPAQREWAANSLSTFNWQTHPEIVQALLVCAQQDPAATVRAACIYSLSRMNAASEPVLSTLHTLRSDGDPRVRQEAEQALHRFGSIR